LWLIGPLTMIGCLGLYLLLPYAAILVLPVWGIIGLFIYFGYSRSRSHVGRGIVEVVPDPNLQPELAERP
jgi:APA family basic amino acid/polyamine antiporter